MLLTIESLFLTLSTHFEPLHEYVPWRTVRWRCVVLRTRARNLWVNLCTDFHNFFQIFLRVLLKILASFIKIVFTIYLKFPKIFLKVPKISIKFFPKLQIIVPFPQQFLWFVRPLFLGLSMKFWSQYKISCHCCTYTYSFVLQPCHDTLPRSYNFEFRSTPLVHTQNIPPTETTEQSSPELGWKPVINVIVHIACEAQFFPNGQIWNPCTGFMRWTCIWGGRASNL